MIYTCTATKILYVLPDNVSDVNCPSQPCATLGQYSLDTGSLPVLSNVAYYFLPGEHHVVNVINMVGALNFSLIGFGASPVKSVCWPQIYISASYSYKLTIRNLAFTQCNGIYKFNMNISAGLILMDCYICKVEDIIIWGHGFVAHNMLMKSFLNNITINIYAATSTVLNACNQKLFLVFADAEIYSKHNSILVNQVFIHGNNEICCHLAAMEIQMHQTHYSVSVI